MDRQEALKNIDITRFLMAIFVVCLHTNPLWDISFLLNSAIVFWLARLAVPFFFICTGFFLEYKEPYDEETKRFRGKTQIIRLLKLYCFWNIIYIFIAFVTKSTGFVFSYKELFVELVIRGGVSILWYVHGAILALVIINMLEKLRIPPVGILSIAFLFYFIGLAGQSYYNIFRKFPIWDNSFVHYIGVSFLSVLGVGGTRHGLFFAFPFVYLGMEIYRHRDSINLKQSVIIFLISMVVGFFEAITTLELHLGIRWDLMIFIVPASYSLFCVLLKIPIDIKIDTHVFRTLSHDIYFIHGALIMLYTYFNLYFHSILYFGTILFVAIAISVLKSVIINFFKEIVNKNVR